MSSPKDKNKPERIAETKFAELQAEAEGEKVAEEIVQVQMQSNKEAGMALVAHDFDRVKFRQLYEVLDRRLDAQMAMEILGRLKVFVLAEDVTAHYRFLSRMQKDFMQAVKVEKCTKIEEFIQLMGDLADVETILLIDNNIEGGDTSEWLLEHPESLAKQNCYAFSYSGQGEEAFQKLINKGLMFPRWPVGMYKSLQQVEWKGIVAAYLAAKAYRAGVEEADINP